MIEPMDLNSCSNFAVPAEIMQHVISVESSNNPFAIGVVGDRLVRQPRDLPEALATVEKLEDMGRNFSVGLAQINRRNFERLGITSYREAFHPCTNISAGAKVLADCHKRANLNWPKAFSCYYSGNFTTGFRDGYVQKLLTSMGTMAEPELYKSIEPPSASKQITRVQHGDVKAETVQHSKASGGTSKRHLPHTRLHPPEATHAAEASMQLASNHRAQPPVQPGMQTIIPSPTHRVAIPNGPSHSPTLDPWLQGNQGMPAFPPIESIDIPRVRDISEIIASQAGSSPGGEKANSSPPTGTPSEPQDDDAFVF